MSLRIWKLTVKNMKGAQDEGHLTHLLRSRWPSSSIRCYWNKGYCQIRTEDVLNDHVVSACVQKGGFQLEHLEELAEYEPAEPEETKKAKKPAWKIVTRTILILAIEAVIVMALMLAYSLRQDQLVFREYHPAQSENLQQITESVVKSSYPQWIRWYHRGSKLDSDTELSAGTYVLEARNPLGSLGNILIVVKDPEVS